MLGGVDIKLEEIIAEVVGLVPVYTPEGSAAKLLYRTPDNNEIVSVSDSRQVEGIKRILARSYAVDLSAQAHLLQRDYHRSPPLPFYLPDGRIFVPFKLRLARILGDAIYGYLALGIIERIIPSEKSKSLIVLTNGTTMPVYSHISTARLALFFGLELEKDQLCPSPDPDQELLQAVRTVRRYLISPNGLDNSRRKI